MIGKSRLLLFILSGILLVLSQGALAQGDSSRKFIDIDYSLPITYELEKISIKGAEHLDKNVLLILSGLSVGQKIKIPGDELGKAIQGLWKQKLFDDIKIYVAGLNGNRIHLVMELTEKPRLSGFYIKGIRKGQATELRDELPIKAGDIITENLINTTKIRIARFYAEKGYLNTQTVITQEPADPQRNTALLRIFVDKGYKIKIHDIIVNGNTVLSDRKIWRQFKETKPKRRFLAKSKYIEDDFQGDKQRIIEKYLSMGYRDIEILSDSIYPHSKKQIDIVINIKEGHKYYFRNITWTGNTKYTDRDLDNILRIKRGDIYDQSVLDRRLNMNQDGLDVTSLYMDDGYLFFNLMPVEVLVENDSIDLEMRMQEGPQAIINRVTVKGNTKTSDHVVLRELRTKPGQKFSRSDITRTLRELSQLGFFDPEQLGVNPVPNEATGTVDIEYKVEERPSDQIELSGGFGGNTVVGTLGLTLNNFSARKLFKPKEWSPIPSGDGQRFSVRLQTTGPTYQNFVTSFTEPWLGGKKPNSLSVSINRSIQKDFTDRSKSLSTTGIFVGLGKRIKWPDDFFTLQYAVSYQRYQHRDPEGRGLFAGVPLGLSHNFNFRLVLGRNSLDQPLYLYPKSGSSISFTVQLTPPYSRLRKQTYGELSVAERTRFVEYHKWKFDAQWFGRLFGNLVLNTRTNFGFMGYYSQSYGITGFERFYLGGSGMNGFLNLDGREVISCRGYQDQSMTLDDYERRVSNVGGTIYNRYTVELRYPITLNPSSTVYLLSFVEGGRAWLKFRDFNPFGVYRSAGLGVRVFLPMFGLIGLDWGYGFDEIEGKPGLGKGQLHFMLGQQF